MTDTHSEGPAVSVLPVPAALRRLHRRRHQIWLGLAVSALVLVAVDVAPHRPPGRPPPPTTVATPAAGRSAAGPWISLAVPPVAPRVRPDPRPVRARAGCPVVRTVLTSAPGSGRTVALTFDDGPGVWTPRVLRVLREHRVPASFFVIGQQAAADPAMLAAVAGEGHLIGNHSWSHRPPTGGRAWDRAELDREERRTQKAIRTALGAGSCWFRPPAGVVRGSLGVTRANRLHTALWSVDPADWQIQRNAGPSDVHRLARRIVRRATAAGGQRHPVVLLHDGGGFRGATVAALPAIIRYYRSHHYRFVRLDE